MSMVVVRLRRGQIVALAILRSLLVRQVAAVSRYRGELALDDLMDKQTNWILAAGTANAREL